MIVCYTYVLCRHIAGVLLHEIDHSPDIVTKVFTDDRESYSLAAGLALGMSVLIFYATLLL